jgi:hypothetical protein
MNSTGSNTSHTHTDTGTSGDKPTTLVVDNSSCCDDNRTIEIDLKTKAVVQSSFSKQQQDRIRKRNALYSQQKYYKKKQYIETLQTRRVQLQSENHTLRQSNHELEVVLRQVHAIVQLHHHNNTATIYNVLNTRNCTNSTVTRPQIIRQSTNQYDTRMSLSPSTTHHPMIHTVENGPLSSFPVRRSPYRRDDTASTALRTVQQLPTTLTMTHTNNSVRIPQFITPYSTGNRVLHPSQSTAASSDRISSYEILLRLSANQNVASMSNVTSPIRTQELSVFPFGIQQQIANRSDATLPSTLLLMQQRQNWQLKDQTGNVRDSSWQNVLRNEIGSFPLLAVTNNTGTATTSTSPHSVSLPFVSQCDKLLTLSQILLIQQQLQDQRCPSTFVGHSNQSHH